MILSYQKKLSGEVGVVFGSFSPLHQGHLDLIMRAKKENSGGALVIVCGYDGDKGEPMMPHAKRYRYVREFFADTDSLVTNMYSQYYSKDSGFALTEEEYETKIKPVAYEYARKSRWYKIFLVVPHGVFVDDHARYMGHADIEERKNLFEILKQSLIDAGDWDKVHILNGNYYENFVTIVNYVKEVMENGKD